MTDFIPRDHALMMGQVRAAVFSGIMDYYGLDEADDHDQEEASGITAAVMEYLEPEVKRLRDQVEHIDYCLDRWNHGAPDALREYWAERADDLDRMGRKTITQPAAAEAETAIDLEAQLAGALELLAAPEDLGLYAAIEYRARADEVRLRENVRLVAEVERLQAQLVVEREPCSICRTTNARKHDRAAHDRASGFDT